MSDLKVRNIFNQFGSSLPENLLPVTSSAWGNYDGVSNIIRGGQNLSSVIDNGTGDYTFNLLNPLNTTNFSAIFQGRTPIVTYANVTTSSVRVSTLNTSGSATDTDLVCFSIFGGQS